MRIAVNHLGFKPSDAGKQAVIWGAQERARFQIVNLNEMGYNEIGPNTQPNAIAYQGETRRVSHPWGVSWLADFTALRTPGLYLVTLDNQYNSVPFQIRDDVYSRTLRKAFDYIHLQRCGQEVPGYHGPCHLDDAVRRDDRRFVDTVGGWHDAGDLRKWMPFTLLLGMAIVKLERLVGPGWRTFDAKEGDLLAELRWGNGYFLKMQDADGSVWHDVAGGVNGDNSDNHWTDNVRGTADDRHVNTSVELYLQWEFVLLESMLARLFATVDPAYAAQCQTAASRAHRFATSRETKNVQDLGWSVWALAELSQADRTHRTALREELFKRARLLLSLQEKEHRFGQDRVRGFWYHDAARKDFYRSTWDPAIPALALAELLDLDDLDPALISDVRGALDLFANGYVRPMVETNAFGIMPYGLYADRPTDEVYRPLAGQLEYRFFQPARGVVHAGLTSHLLSHAIATLTASRVLGDPTLEVIARRQLEWVMGANTELACLMTAEGVNNPYPHSRFLGLIPGGIMNGFAGLEEDRPFLDMSHGMDWRTTEYWSPHTFHYLWYVALASHRR